MDVIIDPSPVEWTAEWPSPPTYSFSTAKSLSTIIVDHLPSDTNANFLRSARWTADCTAVLTTAEDRQIRVFLSQQQQDDASLLPSPVVSKQPDSVTAAVWFPSASALSPETYCFVASIRDGPVRLIDASDGRVRATYPIVDHRERFIAPHCLAFNASSTKIYCGFENAIEVLDLAAPGYGNSERIKTSPTRREKSGQKGIVSAITFNPHDPSTYAAGTYTSSVCLYDEDSGASAISHLEGIRGGGVTQLAFHPLDPTKLFVASRRSSAIQVFDLRDTSAPLADLEIERDAMTNQRMAFDVEPWGRYLACGDTGGRLKVWDIASGEYSKVYDEAISSDSLNSVQFHPYQPLILTNAGSRSYLQSQNVEFSDSDSDSESDSDESDAGSDMTNDSPGLAHVKRRAEGATLGIWSFASE